MCDMLPDRFHQARLTEANSKSYQCCKLRINPVTNLNPRFISHATPLFMTIVLCHCIYPGRSQGSTVSIVIGYRLDDRGV
jgi:hypothetical protein